jgi:glucose/arabinose dehydrogenase
MPLTMGLVFTAGFISFFFFTSARGDSIPESIGLNLSDSNLKVEEVASGLENPTSMAFLGLNDILVLEKDKGTVQRVVNGVIQPTPVLDVNVANERERGMLGIAISPKPQNGHTYVFVYFTESSIEGIDVCPKPSFCIPGNTPIWNRLYRYELQNGQLANPVKLMTLPGGPAPTHNGGKVLIGPDNNLYFTIGDLAEYKTQTQNYPDKSDFNGTSAIYRITQDGNPLPNNPFANSSDPTLLNQLYAYGIRNSFGIDIDPVTGNLWDTENGAAFGDEINLVEPGFNSGWRKVQGIWETKGTSSGGKVILNSTGIKEKIRVSPDGLYDFNGKGRYSSPEFTWFNTSAPTAIKFLNSDKLGRQYENDMFVGDYNGGNIYHFDLSENRSSLNLNGSLADKIEDSPDELKEITFGQGFGSVTDIQVGPDGYLYILSFEEGKIYKIVPAAFPSKGIVNNEKQLNSTNSTAKNNVTMKISNSRVRADIGGPTLGDPNLLASIVVTGLDKPTSMAFLGLNDILVLEKDKGTVQRVVNGVIQPTPVLDVKVATMNERGMLGIALGSKHENDSPSVFLYYTESGGLKDGDDGFDVEPLGNRLYKYELVDNRLINAKLFLDLPASPPPERVNSEKSHMGGKLVVGPDQNLYLGLGNVGVHRTQSENVPDGPTPDGTGGILRITQNGKVVSDPILGTKYPLNLYYAYGIRNTFGLDFDPVTSILWDTENGPKFDDEINMVQPGFNSGWEKIQGLKNVTNGIQDVEISLMNFNNRGEYSDPEFVWNEPIAPTAIKFLNSDKLGQQYKNDIFVGDANLGNLYTFNLNDNRTSILFTNASLLEDKVANLPNEMKETIFGQGFGSITDIQVGPDGYLYVLSFQGSIYKVAPNSAQNSA